MKRILLIEDEKNLARFIELELKHESYEVTVEYDGRKGLESALSEEWDIILLDLMLPGINGIEVCRRIRKTKQTPIIMLTARDGVMDKVMGLDSGADDYIPKPFAIEELLARMRSLLRRSGFVEDSRQITYNGLVLDSEARILTKDQQIIELTKREFDLLSILMHNIGRVMTRERLLELIWGYDSEVETNVVDVYIRYLRSKIDKPGEPSFIQTLRGLGYVIR
ncbi:MULTISPECIES: response regulator transcription factor [Paenibacillus]|uniref:Response regulator transcription factor n=1 Tax=Paenibacillus ottowii TaxID=2315729 RepID=A0ABY3AYS9_9BACL|nr:MULTISPECIES: response regulator transcription factor [Paenibacillus]KZE72441.1 PhoB family transcriptional regulator [Paenibacillus jamilae]NEU29123.1 response regulator transcription factor [Paenibacillus polymyxa]OBA04258.1 DNA-binding response regulator [Paenibacillus polymyxa]TQR95496.1 response regulator transcription factor [Paenibacillus ottowii]